VGISWSSSDVAKAAISPTGQVTAQARWPVTLTASAGGVSGTAAVTVIGVQSISLAPETLSVIVTQTRSMTATTLLDPGVTVTPVWRSLDTTIARVDTAGRITARSITGFARVEVTAEDKKDTAVVRVVPVPVVSVVVSPDTATRTVGQTIQLTATPKDSIGGTLTGRVTTWTSSDTARASVSGSGLVTVKAAGTATISATIEGKSGSAGLTLKVPVADVTVAQSSCTGSGSFSGGTGRIYTSEICEYGALVRDAAGNSLTDRTVTWTLSDTTVAKIDGATFAHPTTRLSTIRLLPRKAGTVTLTATVEGKSSSATLTVLVPVASVTVSPATASVSIGLTQQLTATLKDSAGATITGRTVTWSSSDTAKATVSGTGLVTAKAAGNAILTASSEGRVGTATIQLLAPVVILSDTSIQRLTLGEVVLFGAHILMSDGSTWPIDSIRWSVGDSSIVDVQGGVLRARGSGKTSVTGSFRGGQAVLSIEVGTVSLRHAISTSGNHTCGLTATGSAFCWGSSGAGKLGDGKEITEQWGIGEVILSPQPVSGGRTFRRISAGAHTCAISTDSATVCWGFNDQGQLGRGSLGSSSIPAPVTSSTKFREVATGGYHTCALSFDDRAYCWGRNAYGQLGDGSYTNRSTPVLVSGDVRFATLAAGHDFTCGIDFSRKAHCWGRIGPFDWGVTPNMVIGQDFTSLSPRAVYHICGITVKGQAYCWGSGEGLGNGSTNSALNPVPVGGALSFRSVATGEAYSCGVTSEAVAYCWGSNYWQGLGSATATRYIELTPKPVVGGLTFVGITASELSCGLTPSRSLYCWGGGNLPGQAGTGSFDVPLAPTPVSGGILFGPP
jgi:alpha-tubulin suppressor-like RCC1 family protein/uncharacterized protein YjdB